MKKWKVAVAGTALFLGLGSLFGYLFLSRVKPTLTVATWPEAYGHAQASAQLVPFGNVSGTNVLIAVYDGGTKDLARQVASHQYKWDVADFEYQDAVSACANGLLEPLDLAALPSGTGGISAQADFVPGAIGPCWVASVVYSHVIALNPNTFGSHAPKTAADFFDAKTFPGKRALNQTSAKFILEFALLADGVAPKDVYATLSSPAGMNRALAKLETIKADIIWYKSPAEAAAMLNDGRAAMAFMPNWAVFDADNTPDAHAKLPIIWDRQVYEMEAFGIPKGNPKAPQAYDFIRFATRTENLARMASWIPYGPARKSAVPLVGANPDLKIDMAPYLPTAHFDTAFATDESWWRHHGGDAAQRWESFAR